ncbi:MAG: hypothetical protein ACJ76I_00670 [Gaiellaceae bacterium]
MSQFDTLIREELEPLLPLPGGAPSWDDVLRRAEERRPRPRRRLVLAVALVAAALATVATAAVLNGFSAWLSGTPGSPVSPSEQQAFEEANARTWTQFAPGTELRRLLTTTVSGTDFTLYGFRSGDDLCLKLLAGGSSTGATTRCAPEHDLQTAAEPAIVVSADEPVGGSAGPAGPDGYTPDTYLVTFGIASDGVSRIVVDGDTGEQDAVVGGNAFLSVVDHPKAGARVRSVSAYAGTADRVALPFQSSPYGMFDLASPPKGTLHGPSAVQRHLSGGKIEWLVRGDDRGKPVPSDLAGKAETLALHSMPSFGHERWPTKKEHVVSERLLQPDPNDFIRMIVAGVSPSDSMQDPEAGVCFGELEGAGMSSTCMPLSGAFERGPLWLSLGGSGMSQYSVLAGAASDDVARIAAYLGNGDVLPVALRDNVFVARVARAAYPLRVVAYDASGLVVQVQDFPSDGMTSPAPSAARTSIRTRLVVTADHGATATLRAGDPAGGYRCWSIAFRGGGEEGGCTPWPIKDPPLLLLGAQRAGGDFFLAGQVPPSVAKVEVRFADGVTKTLDMTDGFALAPIPAAETAGDSFFVELRAYDAAGHELARRGLKTSK